MERHLGIIPVAAVIVGTTSLLSASEYIFTSIASSWYLIHFSFRVFFLWVIRSGTVTSVYLSVIIIIIIIIMLYLATGLFSLVLLVLNQQRSPPLRLHVSACSTFRIMRDDPSIAVFRNESIQCFPGMATTFFFKPSVTIGWLQLSPVYSYISRSTSVVSQ
jgi:hypothetical protein